MGAKYYPTIKDQKASQRFQQKQAALAKAKKPINAAEAAKHRQDPKAK
jgi:hypothetical protein